jgi:NCAIR mutase (PurE)-related protein
LLNAEAVRVRAHRMLDIGLAGRLRHFRIKLENLNVAADLVIERAGGGSLGAG